jgi:tryptophan halogenase
MSDWPLKRIVIAGGGTAGWMAAAAIAKTMGPAVDLTLVESDAIGTVGVGESTIPPLVAYNRVLGINEAEFMRATQATFKLGIQFDNWRVAGESYFHSFGITGKDHWSAGFQHFWLAARERGSAGSYDDYCLELKAAQAGKFAHLPEDRLAYAFQLDATAYARFLRQLAEGEGAVRREGKIAEVQRDGENGNITALILESGERIEGDLFVDCTGFRALLIEGALGAGFDDWTHWLPCDSAIAVQTSSIGPPVPFTRAIAHGEGWQWRIPLQHRVGNGIVFCSNFLQREEALERLTSNLQGDVLTKPNHLAFKAGARRKQWHKNCIAVGLSGGFMEPLEATSIHLIQRSVLRLLRMLPLAEISQRDVDEFNEQQQQDMAQIRDFLILHYKATERDDSEFWRYCRNMPIPDTLAQKIELFRETGRVFRKNEELFAENSWVQVMMGQGITPRAYHPIATKLSDDELGRLMQTISSGVEQTVGSLPGHQDYVARYCGASAADAA